jgi:capsular polysaccharide biosynthesis protein
MSHQMNLREAIKIARRNKTIIGVAVAVGLIGGAAYGSINPAVLTAQSLVLVQTTNPTDEVSTNPLGTQVIVATSTPVLTGAQQTLGGSESLTQLKNQVTANSPTDSVLEIDAQGSSAEQAEQVANAVANSYVTFVGSSESPVGKVAARMLQPASTATGTSPIMHRLTSGLIGLLAGGIIGFVVALARSRRDRRLRQRDDIANALGVPVLASVPASRPVSAQDWAKLLGGYQPGVLHAWRLRKALQHLAVAGVNVTSTPHGTGTSSVAVVSIAGDQAALALGPQLAVFAVSLGIPTSLVVGPQEDPNVTAALRTACAEWGKKRQGDLRVAVADQGHSEGSAASGFAVIVSVVDGADPKVDATMEATATVIGVSAGAVTADQLARVGISAIRSGRDVSGILVANPDPLDHTTGRAPQLAVPAARRMPSRMAGRAATTTEVRR